ncbi:E3 SUMO-protein ligase pli1 [Exophiala xenobiotica]|uniref:E3 SUMO-protein ligase pli1 n=1 Tax=Vermiconidia calcicola TaxID=1690605 RepID=A0AAV9QL11_9PEZI|nr:E3 SUMO-protein ligase pli1 [Exophiala xenobiotica]KAK5544119.1 E3 SUMO-protein ligase pli1 [Vermiconidia calcicola]KAK5547601.1 E3 SUMO-protein ligase pli1 [Chaetothyriales sp. CCFEE 6169]KAK5229446.1 E3 SUMO-protein ligase pli1 [Exophiala xenobiotica]KAK5233878.1 E3 SUMO-protein ligase pli1 [Exophiala xenobiotica]
MPSTSSSFPPSRIVFKKSPFYNIIRPLTQTLECRARETSRETARLTVTLGQQVRDQLESDSTYRIMVFCAGEGFPSFASRESEIAFPHNVELKCNSDEVKVNLRGLKNRPGSTKPADITDLLRKKPPNYPNIVEMIYALTSKAKPTTQKFYLVVNIVQKKSIDSLVSEIRRGRTISKDQVLREMRMKADDPDIVATSSVLSLKDPVAYTRIVTPCRSIGCNHNQCFDAGCFLQLQEQAPTWTCPICNKAAPWENLVLDQYVNDILNSTPTDTEAVTVQPDGQWAIQKETESSNQRKHNPTPSDDDYDDDDDGDLVEIGDKPNIRLKVETLTPRSVRTPPFSSREESSAPSASRSSNKRPREDVIDLTLSDDEAPAPKAPKLPVPSSSVRPPERYHFQLPPPSAPSYNFDRFNQDSPY